MIPVQLFQGVLSFGGPDVGWMNYRNHAGGFIASRLMARLVTLADNHNEWLPGGYEPGKVIEGKGAECAQLQHTPARNLKPAFRLSPHNPQ